MPQFKISTPRLMAVHNEYRLTGGGGTANGLTGKISPTTGKPFFQAAIGDYNRSDFTRTEVSVPVSPGSSVLKSLALDTRPAFKNLADLEAAIGRPLADGEWVKTFWTTLSHEDGQPDWRFDDMWPQYSAKHQITAADRAADAATGDMHKTAPVISFINDLGSAVPENPKLDYDGVKRTYLLRRIELNASAVQGTYLELTNVRTVAELEALQTRKVRLAENRFADPAKPVKVHKNAEVTLDLSQSWPLLAPPGAPSGLIARHGWGPLFNASLEWTADGATQAPITIATVELNSINFVSTVKLPTPPGVTNVEFWFVSELPGPTPNRTVYPGNSVTRKIDYVG